MNDPTVNTDAESITTLTFDEDGNFDNSTENEITFDLFDPANTSTNPITLDFSALTQYEGSSTALVDPNGNTEGKLESYNIGSLGEINGVYSNGEIIQSRSNSDCQIQQHIWSNENGK